MCQCDRNPPVNTRQEQTDVSASVSPSLPPSPSKFNKLKKTLKPHLVKSPFYSGLILPLPLVASFSPEATKVTSSWRHFLERHVINKYEKCINVISKNIEMVPYTVFCILLHTATELGITACWSREILFRPSPSLRFSDCMAFPCFSCSSTFSPSREVHTVIFFLFMHSSTYPLIFLLKFKNLTSLLVFRCMFFLGIFT